MHKIKFNAMFYLIVFFVLLNIVDIITTMFILPGESNPIYILTNSLIFFYIFKIFMVVLICWIFYYNKFNNQQSYFLFVTIIFYGTLALLLAQIINISAMSQPAVLTQAAQAPASEKVNSYLWVMNIIYILPILFTWTCFIIYSKSVNDVEFKKRSLLWF